MAGPELLFGLLAGGAAASVVSGAAQQQQGSNQQAQARENAKAAEADAVFEASGEVRAGKARAASIRARSAAAGLAPDETLANLIDDELIETGLNAAIIRVGGSRESLRQKQLGVAARAQGNAGLISTSLGAVTTGLKIADRSRGPGDSILRSER